MRALAAVPVAMLALSMQVVESVATGRLYLAAVLEVSLLAGTAACATSAALFVAAYGN